MVRFDPTRPDFSPYGFSCVRWTPTTMPRCDRHNEIELNLLESGTLVYLMGGARIAIPAGRLTVFWAGVPHQILDFEGLSEYFVLTISLGVVPAVASARSLHATDLARGDNCRT